MVALAAHELRTPVNVVIGYLRMLRQGQAGALAEAQQALIDAADRSTVRIIELLGDLADLVGLECGSTPLDRQPTPLTELLGRLDVGAAPPDRPPIQVLAPVPEVLIDADRTRLPGALATLARAGRTRDEHRELAARAWIEGDRDELDVSIVLGSRDIVADAGPDARGTWQTFDYWRGGYGLALVLAARTVALHDGALWTLVTRPGRAATLVRLPTSASRAA